LIIELTTRYYIKDILLIDDNFFVDLKRVARICELLIESKLDVTIYNANCRADTIVKMDDNFLQLLKRAGFVQIFIGAESGSDEVLSRIKKDLTVDQVLTVNRKLKDAGIIPFYSFMVGFPFETTEDVKKTLSLMGLLLRENPEAIVFKLQYYTPFPGTELFHYASKHGMRFPESLEDWTDYHYDRINYDGFSSSHRKFLEDCHYYSTFLDKKVRAGNPQYMQLISSLFSRILKFRIKHEFYSCRYELLPLNIGRKIRKRWFAQDSGIK
jgi:radical SAM superfamily enzyme YgiQ (UPF0313 family)